jgi:hypothetical protein
MQLTKWVASTNNITVLPKDGVPVVEFDQARPGVWFSFMQQKNVCAENCRQMYDVKDRTGYAQCYSDGQAANDRYAVKSLKNNTQIKNAVHDDKQWSICHLSLPLGMSWCSACNQKGSCVPSVSNVHWQTHTRNISCCYCWNICSGTVLTVIYFVGGLWWLMRYGVIILNL